MNGLKDLLGDALAGNPALDPARPVDPTGDLARGRTLLRRRRLLTGAGVTSAALALVLSVPIAFGTWNGDGAASVASPRAPVVVDPSGRPSSGDPAVSGDPSASGDPVTPGGTVSLGAVELVAYTGKQVPGYRVAEVPQGWAIQGGDPYALTIAQTDATDTDPNSFLGKLVIMLESRDAAVPPTDGATQLVDGRSGRYRVGEDTQVLVFPDAADHWLVVQAPTTLGWDADRLAAFAAGVEVLSNAEAGRG